MELFRRLLLAWFKKVLPLSGDTRERIVSGASITLASILGITDTTPVIIGTEPSIALGRILALGVVVLLAVVAAVNVWLTTPRLDLILSEALIHIDGNGRKLVRLGVVNHGFKTVKRCRVQLYSFTPQGATFLPRTLRYDHASVDESDINPGSEPQYLLRLLNHHDQENVFQINYADNSPKQINKGNYVFTLLMSAEDQPSQFKSYDVHTDGVNRIDVSPHKDRRPKIFSIFGRVITVQMVATL